MDTTENPDTLPLISTPDRRVRVFVSSTLQELAAEREAARRAIRELRLTPVMFEMGARAHPPRALYRAYLAQSDVFVGIYGESYGWIAPGEPVSGLEDEYLLSDGRPKLIYVRHGGNREPRLVEMIERIKSDDRASYRAFESPAELAELLADDLAVLLTERFTAHGTTASGGPTAPALPRPATPLVGRETELAAVQKLLLGGEARLVTLVGPGGIGKSSLAIEAAWRLHDEAPAPYETVAFIDLSSTTDSTHVPEVIAAGLGVRPEGNRPMADVLIDHLRSRTALLVLDNLEQLAGATPFLGALLLACPGVTLMATSRVALHLHGERQVMLQPLPLPAKGSQLSVEELQRSPAVQLFLARARQVRPGFTLNHDNLDDVAELCRRLDGVPLALELAAVQLRILSPAALLRQLRSHSEGSLDLRAAAVDTPGRQQTLRATIDWSYDLLREPERRLLARLSIFTRPWTLDAAQALADDDPGELSGSLSSLVAQSLVNPVDPNAAEPRFRMLESVRAYALERLADQGGMNELQLRLGGYLADLAVRAAAGLAGEQRRSWTDRINLELDEIRSCARWSTEHDDATLAAQLLGPLFTFWWNRGLIASISADAERIAGLPSAQHLDAPTEALLLRLRAMGRIEVGAPADAKPLIERLRKLALTLGDVGMQAQALLASSWAHTQGHLDDAEEPLAQATTMFRELHDEWGLAVALSTSGQILVLAGDAKKAEPLLLESLEFAEVIEDDVLQAHVLDLLGLNAALSHDRNDARQRYGAAAALHLRLLDHEGAAYCLAGLAFLALRQHKREVAAQLLGASDRARTVAGVSVWPAVQRWIDGLIAQVRDKLGERACHAAMTTGSRMSLAEALTYAVETTEVTLEEHRDAGSADHQS